MIVIALSALLLVYVVTAELRIVRRRRADRLAVLETLARSAGVINAVRVGRDLGWIDNEDVRADGDVVKIRLRRRLR